jgi:UDP-N-acetylglucosamine/UDP-N-acetyl-alpha-D-glucosaminouronate 4-epimerase
VKVLVTGGAGFIGHHLATALVARGDDVVVLDDFSTGRRERLDRAGVARVVDADLRTGPGVVDALRDREVVFHLAAIASVAKSVRDPETTNAVNVDGTVRLMVEAARIGVRRVVVASSSAVYGERAKLPSQETDRPEPHSPYATSKLAAEHYAHNLGEMAGIETVALRFFNVFGPDQDPNAEYAAVVPRFIVAALNGEEPVIYGDGRQSRDFVHVDDVVAANLAAADRPDVSGLTANVGSGERRSLLDLLDAVAAAAGRKLSPIFEPARPGDVRDSQADITVASERLGFRPRVDFHEGIRRTMESYRQAAVMARSGG